MDTNRNNPLPREPYCARVVEYVLETHRPEDIFPAPELQDWANRNGYLRVEA